MNLNFEIPRVDSACKCLYRKHSKIWDTSNNCHNCPKIEKFDVVMDLISPDDENVPNSLSITCEVLSHTSGSLIIQIDSNSDNYGIRNF